MEGSSRGTSSVSDDAIRIFQCGVDAVKPEALILSSIQVNAESKEIRVVGVEKSEIQKRQCGDDGNVWQLTPTTWVLGIGKAAGNMATTLVQCIQPHVSAVKGHVLIPCGSKCVFDSDSPNIDIEVHACSPNNLPDQAAVVATEKLIHTITSIPPDDLVITLISGGGSALLVAPAVPLQDYLATISALVSSGAPIHELNTIRKHISNVKGGLLAKHMKHCGSVVNLLLSDVIGDELSVIASGPTVPDDSTFSDCWDIIQKRCANSSDNAFPQSVLHHINRGLQGEVPDTPSSSNQDIFENQHHFLIGSNAVALHHCHSQAVRLGYEVKVLSPITTTVEEAAHMFFDTLQDLCQAHVVGSGDAVCVLAGGETVVQIRGDGVGGRCQELSLRFAKVLYQHTQHVVHDNPASPTESPPSVCDKGMPELQSLGSVVFLCAGTDGQDGPTDASGAVVGLNTWQSAVECGLDPESHLLNSDSYTLLSSLHNNNNNNKNSSSLDHVRGPTASNDTVLLKTGLTGTNVTDVMMLCVVF